MKDLQTDSVWSHLDGVALTGELAGTRMELAPVMHATWDEWRRLHPDTLVLSEDTRWKRSYRNPVLGRPGLGGSFVESVLRWDSRLPQSTLVVGVEVNGSYGAYVLDLLDETGRVANDEIAGQPVVVWYAPEAVSAAAYSRLVGDMTLEFRVVSENRFEDAATGSTWDLQGLAVAGELKGTRLEYVPSFITEWYGWAAFHPETAIYDYELAKQVVGVAAESDARRGLR